MPMTSDESKQTISILLKYMSPHEVRAFVIELWREVGSKSENSSVRDTLQELVFHTESQKLPPLPCRVYFAWFFIFLFHWLVALANLASACVMLVCAVTPLVLPEWAIACPLITFVVWTTTSRKYDCPLTIAEDAVRQYYGLPAIKAFLGSYLVRPLRRAWTPQWSPPSRSQPELPMLGEPELPELLPPVELETIVQN
jgi:hypothetical protein